MSDTPVKEELRMEAYYYGFRKTGNSSVDRILSAVACAGKSYHRTEDWCERSTAWIGHEGDTPVEWIQNAADDANDSMIRLERELATANARLSANEVLLSRAKEDAEKANAKIAELQGQIACPPSCINADSEVCAECKRKVREDYANRPVVIDR
jgi:hypothetical protein